MSNISTCEAVELVRNAIDPYSMMGISADDMVYATNHSTGIRPGTEHNRYALSIISVGLGIRP